MLKLYYTSTKGQDEVQSKFYSSLGGYKSSTPVRNDSFDNFFGEVSSYTIANNSDPQYIGLVLKNEGADKTGLKIYFERDEKCYSKIYVAAVTMIADSDGKYMFEHVPTLNSSPLYATFYEAEGVDTAVSLGDLDEGAMIGLWLKREILRDVAEQDASVVAVQDPEDEHRMIPVVLDKLDTINMVLEYD
jgi:hypothetical protein